MIFAQFSIITNTSALLLFFLCPLMYVTIIKNRFYFGNDFPLDMEIDKFFSLHKTLKKRTRAKQMHIKPLFYRSF